MSATTNERDLASPLADPALRLVARWIDVALPLAPALVFVPLGAALDAGALVRGGLLATVVATIALFALNLMLLHRYGQSLGKRVLGLRIVRSDGSPATLGTILGRRIVLAGVLAGVPFLGAIFTIADVLCVFTESRQTLHDRIADTIVIDVRRGATSSTSDVARVFE
ncbi:RDD family protein [Sandaracinus amylolyticus]|uniref:RDD family protein n=1 Tax=Sandaracinus amylolyticus TaxID=927083 RepID=UPI001F46999B|nr:RDD family protein [Sandaracinus amylolyticus]UJR85390.1 Hypothetical protein I5071_74700 [Sandaracinus amylolyticus]